MSRLAVWSVDGRGVSEGWRAIILTTSVVRYGGSITDGRRRSLVPRHRSGVHITICKSLHKVIILCLTATCGEERSR